MQKKNLIVFDIDDTLTKSENQHQTAYVNTMQHFGITKINQDWKTYLHHTDSYILKENYEANFKEAFQLDFIPSFEEKMTASILKLPKTDEIKGASTVVDFFMRETDYAICFATGSLLEPAFVKLAQASINFVPDLVEASNTLYSRERIVQSAIKKAKQYFTKAVNLSPKDPEIRNNYGSFLCDTGQAQAAIAQFTASINDPLHSTPEFAYTNAGICLRKIGDDTKAEEYFRNALRKKSAFPSALLEMAGLYSDRKKYPRAQAFMSRYESVGKSTPKALELCTIINQKMDDIAKSESCKSALLRIFPESAEAQRVN